MPACPFRWPQCSLCSSAPAAAASGADSGQLFGPRAVSKRSGVGQQQAVLGLAEGVDPSHWPIPAVWLVGHTTSASLLICKRRMTRACALRLLRGSNAQTRQALRMATYAGLRFSRCHAGRVVHGQLGPSLWEAEQLLVSASGAKQSACWTCTCPGEPKTNPGRAQPQAPGPLLHPPPPDLSRAQLADAWAPPKPPQEPETWAQSQGFRHQMALVRPGPGGQELSTSLAPASLGTSSTGTGVSQGRCSLLY